MEKKSNLYVLEKKEVALIFIFMVLVAITSFAFGVKVGKNYMFKMSEMQPEDKQLVESMLSKKEESMEKVVEEKKARPVENTKAVQDTYNKLKEEFDKLENDTQEDNAKLNVPKIQETSITPSGATIDKSQSPAKSPTQTDQYAGKFTVQLGSHKNIEDAEKFADGFRVRGYNPIINEVEIPGRGPWFRVSLGVFDTINETKEFIIKEKSLFQGMDYVIGRFD